MVVNAIYPVAYWTQNLDMQVLEQLDLYKLQYNCQSILKISVFASHCFVVNCALQMKYTYHLKYIMS